MPPEIADSDDEVDVVEQEPGNASSPVPTRGCDQTQRLSDQGSSAIKGTGSTDKLIRTLQETEYVGVEDLDQAFGLSGPNGRKRALSETPRDDMNVDLEGPKNKRNKTYGSKTRANYAEFFNNPPPSVAEAPVATSTTDYLPTMDSPTSPLEPASASKTRQRDRPRRVASLLEIGNERPYSTSLSSMGGHRSMNVDPNANPFGTDSQPVMDDDHAVDGSRPDLSQNLHLNDLINEFAEQNAPSQMSISPARPSSPVAPAVEPLSDSETAAPPNNLRSGNGEESERPLKRRNTAQTPVRSSALVEEQQIQRSASVTTDISAASKPVVAKKRGRPAKAKKALDVDIDADTDELHSVMGPPARASSVDISSQVSQPPQSASNTKRKRKRSKVDDEPADVVLKQHPSSELNLSDEAMIGLPKENYKPRPSRSRSKRTDEDGGTPAPESTASRAQTAEIATPRKEATPAKRSTAKGKKSKVKRAKTSAAGLLKASAPMFEDGEEDVLWVETKPSPVKLDLPPDLAVLKKEQTPDINESADELQSNAGRPKQTLLSVEVPIMPDAQSDAAAEKKTSKKRGRKPKQGLAAAQEEDSERAPLAEKDINKAPNKTTNAKSKPIITDSDDEEEDDKENAEQTAAAAPKADAATPPKDNAVTPQSPSPTKPAIHSPLKTTLSASSVSSQRTQRYRVGLSKRSSIPSLLRKVQRDKPPPTKTGVKVKEFKVAGINDGTEGEEGEGKWPGVLRDKDGRLVEWDF
ncbi:uncharacterized protein AB675_1666 [Cyphellophora attinorum]|uniref:Uncharacterized protein n=1 Tax=Cyphellophora attinorum TaxID=1664694 RepID=A0A0N1NXY7_9EURO|nr:uncharacterized protein AB675_1666 [Phialophora attinorum]KPI36096.1 hypothetical protein AB675_1666 [Phialophora attinorum]